MQYIQYVICHSCKVLEKLEMHLENAWKVLEFDFGKCVTLYMIACFFPLSQAIGATFAAMIGAGILVRSISYEHSPFPKHLAWMAHAGL